MFALAVVDKLSPGELTGGRFVAGTGAIDAAGDVSPIGGIPFKMRAARDAGATVVPRPRRQLRRGRGDRPGRPAARPRHAAWATRCASSRPSTPARRSSPADADAAGPTSGVDQRRPPTGTPHAVRRVGHAGRGTGGRRRASQPARARRDLTNLWSVSRGHAAPGGSPDAEPPHPDPAHRRGRPGAAAARRVPPDHLLRRLALVRRGRLPQRLHHDPLHPDPAVPARRGADRRRGRAVAVDRLPVPAGVRAGVGPRGPDRALPHGDHLAAAGVRDRHPGARRPGRRARGAGRLADRPAVPALHAVRRHRPRVRHRRQLLRLRAAVLPLGAGLAVRRGHDQLHRRAGRPLPVRRHPADRPRRAGLAGRARPAGHARRACSCCSRPSRTTSTGTSCCTPGATRPSPVPPTPT